MKSDIVIYCFICIGIVMLTASLCFTVTEYVNRLDRLEESISDTKEIITALQKSRNNKYQISVENADKTMILGLGKQLIEQGRGIDVLSRRVVVLEELAGKLDGVIADIYTQLKLNSALPSDANVTTYQQYKDSVATGHGWNVMIEGGK
jgi:hypothetical protein